MEKKRLVILSIIIILFMLCIFLSYTYYKNKYIVSFETGTTEKIISQYVKRNNSIKKPKNPKKDGYVFVEWQKNGKKYNFKNKIVSDTVLTAKWLKDEYVVITYKDELGNKLDSEKILKGSTIQKPVIVPLKDNYEFLGWYFNDILYNNQDINSDITLIAKYVKKEIKYEIGDIVTIIGGYAESCYNIESPYTSAIGWNRRVLDIIDNTNYPYVIGNEYGVTGFFKSDSLKKGTIK